MTGQDIENYNSKILKACMSINGAFVSSNLGSNVEIVLPKDEWQYIKLSVLSDKNSKIYKFYKEIDAYSFLICNVKLVYKRGLYE